MKNIALVLMYAISMASFASNTAVTAQVNNSSSNKLLGQQILLAKTINTAKNSTALTNRVAVIAKNITAAVG